MQRRLEDYPKPARPGDRSRRVVGGGRLLLTALGAQVAAWDFRGSLRPDAPQDFIFC